MVYKICDGGGRGGAAAAAAGGPFSVLIKIRYNRNI